MSYDMRWSVFATLGCACGPTIGSEPSADAATETSAAASESATADSETDPATSTSTDSTTGDGESDHDGGVGFIATSGCAPPPGSDTLLVCECDLWWQDCPGGHKCAPWSNDGSDVWNAVKCTPVAPEAASVGSPCSVEGSATSGVDSCELGAMCWNVDPGTLQGHCVGFCTGTPQRPACDDPNDACAILNGGRLILCLPSCDPLADDCDEGFACRPNAASDQTPTAFVCMPMSAGGKVLDGCEAEGPCPAQQACVSSDVIETCRGSCCAHYCDLEDPAASERCADLAGGDTCVPFFAEATAPSAHANVGVCAPS